MKVGDIVLARAPGMKSWRVSEDGGAWEGEVVEVCADGDIRVRPTPETVDRWQRTYGYDPAKDGSGISRHPARDVRPI